MTDDDADDEFISVLVGLLVGLKRHGEATSAALAARIDALERRAGLQGKSRVVHRGAWEPGRLYRVGDAALIDRQLFVARLNHVSSSPAQDPIGWRRVQ